jgi:PemK-like, MazF-like toxin of type II toxin-antitoxin system
MPFPEPRLGLVISYAYLWHHEHRAGREEGSKNRPCVIILAVEHPADDVTMVRVVPVTHRAPDDLSTVLELPLAVKHHLGLDDDRSWVILDEVNEFAWPGFDLRPLQGSRDRFEYGFLPPALFGQLMTKLTEVWGKRQGKAIPRD